MSTYLKNKFELLVQYSIDHKIDHLIEKNEHKKIVMREEKEIK